jgi:flagellar motor protein MotB
VAFIDRSTRVGRSQGASIFWGIVSVCFAAAACFYFFKNQKNETAANQMRDTVRQLQDENDVLNSQKAHLQASAAEAESQLKTREDLVAEKETELAAEETRIEALGQQSQSQSGQNQAQVAIVKKFNDLIHKLGNKDTPPDVVERGGRPVLRVPNSQLFAPGDSALTPDGKALLNQIAQTLNDQLDNFELRVVSYTDTDAESDEAAAPKKDTTAKPGDESAAKPHFASSWDLTAARAAVIARYYRDQTQLPFRNVLVIGRGDSEPISPNAGEGHARNQRVEITIAPLPVPFHSPDLDKTDPGSTTSKATAPSTDTPAPAKKVKEKKVDKPADKPKSSGH